MKNKQMTILIIIFSAILTIIVGSLFMLNTRIEELKEESKKLSEIQESLNSTEFALKDDIPTKMSDLEIDVNIPDQKEIDDKFSDIEKKINQNTYAPYSYVSEKNTALSNRIDNIEKNTNGIKTDVDELKKEINSIKTSSNSKTPSSFFEEMKSQFRDYLYPVGSLYYSMDKDFDPNVTWGGTWEKIDEGNFIEATQDETKITTHIDAGIPNIIAFLDPQWRDSSAGSTIFGTADYAKGAFYLTQKYVTYSQARSSGTYYSSIHFDASKGETKADGSTYKDASEYHVYGKSDTVQPNAYYAYIWKRIS